MMCLPLVTGAQAGWPLTGETECHHFPARLPGVPVREADNPVLRILRNHQGPRSLGFAGRGRGRPEPRSTTLISALASAFRLSARILAPMEVPALPLPVCIRVQHPACGPVIIRIFFHTCLSCHVGQGKFLGFVSQTLAGGIDSSTCVSRKSKHMEYRL